MSDTNSRVQEARDQFARELRKAATDSGLTQSEIAEAVGVTQPTVSAWLMGKVFPDIESVEALATLLGQEKEPWTYLKLQTMRRVRRRPIDESTRVDPADLTGKLARLSPGERAILEALADQFLDSKSE